MYLFFFNWLGFLPLLCSVFSAISVLLDVRHWFQVSIQKSPYPVSSLHLELRKPATPKLRLKPSSSNKKLPENPEVIIMQCSFLFSCSPQEQTCSNSSISCFNGMIRFLTRRNNPTLFVFAVLAAKFASFARKLSKWDNCPTEALEDTTRASDQRSLCHDLYNRPAKETNEK